MKPEAPPNREIADGIPAWSAHVCMALIWMMFGAGLGYIGGWFDTERRFAREACERKGLAYATYERAWIHYPSRSFKSIVPVCGAVRLEWYLSGERD